MQTERITLLKETALKYYEAGYFVFPVGGRKNKDGTLEDKHWKKPARTVRSWSGKTMARADLEFWFSDPAITGVALRLDGLVAIDIDTYRGQEIGSLNKGAGCICCGRGVTALWKLPAGMNLKTNDKHGNCEVKTGCGAYIVIPPSMHLDKGTPYGWALGTGPWDAVVMPEELLHVLQKDTSGPAASRHALLLQHAIDLKKEGKNYEEVLAGLVAFNSTLAAPKEDPEELPAIARWVMRAVEARGVSQLMLRDEFVHMYRETLRYVVDVGRECWRAWNGHYWEEYGHGQLKALCTSCVDLVRDVAKDTSFKFYWISSLASWAPGAEEFHVKEEIFDRQLDVLNCKNVTWSPNGVYEPRKEDYITRYTDVNYIPERLKALQGSRWGEFLSSTCAGQNGLQAWLQLAGGYSIYGANIEQVIFFVCGLPNTGKSTFLEAIRGVLGPYATTMRSQTLLRGVYTQQNSPDVAQLQGKRLVVSSELPQGSALDTQLLKNLTGNEVISATAKYKAPTQFRPEAKIWLAGNDLPRFPYEDLGVRKRVKVIRFANVVLPRDQDRTLRDIFANDEFEKEIILAWLLEGAQKYYREQRLDEPQCVLDETAAYAMEQDPMACWFRDCCTVARDAQLTYDVIRLSYQVWAQSNSRALITDQAIGTWLKAKGFKKDVRKIDGKQQRVWFGFTLVD